MFLNNSADAMPVVCLSFIHDVMNVPEGEYNWDMQYYFASTSTLAVHFSSHRIENRAFTYVFDMALDTIPDRKTM
jgi:hypothetical protein